MTFIIVATIILLVFTLLLLTPIILYVNTKSNQYYIQWKGLFKAILEADDSNIFRLCVKIWMFKFYIYPLKIKSKKHKVKQEKLVKKNFSFKRLISIIKTFKVKQFYVNIDTGNYIYNAKLYSLLPILNYNSKSFHINHQGQNELKIVIENRLINLIKSFINF